MNMQALMRQAQNLQKDMMKAKDEIDKTEFVGESSLVKITMKGNREVTKVEISKQNSLSEEDIEMLEDMILLAVNDANKKIEEFTNKKMGKFGNSMPGLF
ncbi:MAG: YbaB/EbfC family nucleoid-associated protein [bacterium]|nr:YbaB/EbfC family nucleoid-associated protein [bacterium]